MGGALSPLRWVVLFLMSFSCSSSMTDDSEGMPLPWMRELRLTDPPMTGNDILIAQTLISRKPGAPLTVLERGVYDADTEAAVIWFQQEEGLSTIAPKGIFENETASLLLSCCLEDGYFDAGLPAAYYGKLYKIIVPIPSVNRSIEATATLLDSENNEIRRFRVRAHGVRDDGSSAPWPDFGNGDIGLNMLSPNGNTPTGLSTVDLNSPEPASSEPAYGPYPVNRVVNGLAGNMRPLLSTNASSAIRSGILLHTGEWANATDGQWDPSKPMPNSDGCLHAHPDDVEAIWHDLESLGVEVRQNPLSTVDYPYEPQGIISIFLNDTSTSEKYGGMATKSI